MAVTRESQIVSFDADAAVSAALAADREHVRVGAEYDIHDWQILYVAEHVVEEYEASSDDLEGRGAGLHSYIHLDFTEQELFEDLAPGGGDVLAVLTKMEHRVLVRYLFDHEGLFLSLEEGVDLTAVLDAVEAAVE